MGEETKVLLTLFIMLLSAKLMAELLSDCGNQQSPGKYWPEFSLDQVC